MLQKNNEIRKGSVGIGLESVAVAAKRVTDLIQYLANRSLATDLPTPTQKKTNPQN